jgi:hypothetical protein
LVGLVAAAQAGAHGYLVNPVARTDDDYQFTPDPCGEFPNPGPATTTYQSGQTIDIDLNITVTHGSGDYFRFQLCETTDITEQCFLDGEIVAFLNEGNSGIHQFQVDLPDGVTCDACVFRWKWDYAFFSCADVEIVPEPSAAMSGCVAIAALAGLARLATRVTHQTARGRSAQKRLNLA